MKVIIFALVMLLSLPCFALTTESHGNDTAWQIFEHTLRGKNELCPTTVGVGVYKVFKDTKLGCDVEVGTSYKGWVRNITQENEWRVLQINLKY